MLFGFNDLSVLINIHSHNCSLSVESGGNTHVIVWLFPLFLFHDQAVAEWSPVLF